MYTARNAVRSLVLWLTLAATLAALGGCLGKSPPARFYLLGTQAAAPSREAPCIGLGIGPVDFPAYLDRTQIVTRIGANRIQMAEFDQWAEPLSDAFPRLLAEVLGSKLCAEPLLLYPWPTGAEPEYSVAVQVLSFDGDLGKTATLHASWSLLDASGKALLWRTASYSAPAAGGEYAAYAAALSDCIGALGQDIAQALQSARTTRHDAAR